MPYKFIYEDEDRKVTFDMKEGTGDTWNEVLPVLMDFLKGVGFVFDPEVTLQAIDGSGNEYNPFAKLVSSIRAREQENDKV